MKEAAFTSRFRLWAKRNLGTCAVEVKHTRGRDVFHTRELKEHQLMSLLAAQSDTGLAYKIPDDGRAYKPFDMVLYRNSDAWLVVCYPEVFCVIDAADCERVKRKASLGVGEASSIARLTLPLSVL